MRISSKTFAALALSLSIGTAQAALVNFTLTGEALYPDAGNGFGLSNGDLVTVVGIFDDNALTGGLGTIDFGFGSGNSFTSYAGNYSYSNADDDLYAGGGYPTLEFAGGPLPDLNFSHFGTTTFSSVLGMFDGTDGNCLVSGVWTDFETTAVLVPAAVWLFGSGLLGLAGVARRKTAA